MIRTAPSNDLILLVAVNARYSHCAFGVRSLLANLGPLAENARLLETDLAVTPLQLAERIACTRPRIVGFSVYLWNVCLIESTVRILRIVAPEIRLIAGGPELTSTYPNIALFNTIILGEGESTCRTVCESFLATESPASPTRGHVLRANPENPDGLTLPYAYYTDEDLSHRTVYVESSRGCPHSCAYCTSAGTGLRLIPLDRLLPAFDRLWQRGLRRFKFLDRTFNAPVPHATAVLDFFLARATRDMRIHLEINPDTLTNVLCRHMAAFPPKTLHLEVGLQTLNSQTAGTVGRSRDRTAALANLRFLTCETGATVHADLIFGLPGENKASFVKGFNTLINACDPPEVQINLLKGLPGTRLAMHADQLRLSFNPEPPYDLLYSDVIDFATLTSISHFARCWELVHNRGRFPRMLRILHGACKPDIYTAYQTLTERLIATEGKLFAISLPRLGHLLAEHLCEIAAIPAHQAGQVLAEDLNTKPE